MAPKKPPKKVKKPLTEEEMKAKADFEALKVEEMRKKAIRDRRAAFKQAMIDEEKRSLKSMLQIHKDWRVIMRTAKIEEQRRDIDWLAKKHVHQVETKDHFIDLYKKQMDESEAQHRSAQIKHLSMLDVLIDLHFSRIAKMEEEFQENLKGLESSFMTERNLMTSNHEKQKTELKDMIVAMQADADEAIDERRQVFEALREELKNKNVEEYNMLKLSLERGIEELERRIEHTHQQYLGSTEAKTISFKSLVAKDAVTARIIEQRMRKLIKVHEELALWRGRIITKGKEWDTTNTHVREEKEVLLEHYIDLKSLLDRISRHEHNNLKEVSRHVLDATNSLMGKYVAAQRVLVMAKYVSKLETDHEKIFPFDPLHCSTIPTVPGTLLDRDMADEDLAEKEREENGLGVPIVPPSQFPAEPLTPPVESGKQRFHWGSYALNQAGNEVEEIDYMTNFNKRFNKAKLDTLAIQMERNKMSAENTKLASALRNYIESQTIPEKLKREYNILVTIKKKPNSPRLVPAPWYEPPARKTKPAEQES